MQKFFIVIKILEDLTRKSPFHCFSFSDIRYTFSYFFNQTMFISYISYKLIPFSQVPISLIESPTSSLLEYRALYVDETPDH